MIPDAPNVQVLWGALLVEELVRCGVTRFVVSPGARSAPIVQAVARHPDADVTTWLDERGAAYHALGWARATGDPAAVITTSGTAVANLLPAAVEASLDGVPLLLLTADRPVELREVGANQSIRQVGFLADHVRWAFDLPAPDACLPARMVLTTVDHAVFKARDDRPGPVQINCAFREPLAPDPVPYDDACLEGLEDWLAGEDPFTSIQPAAPACPRDEAWLEELADALLPVSNGLLVAGDVRLPHGVDALASALGWPVWTDVRCEQLPGVTMPNYAPHVDRLLGNGFEPDVVIQIGERLTSKRLQSWIEGGHVPHTILVDADPSRLDPGHRITQRYVDEPGIWCDALWEALMRKRPDGPDAPTALLAADAAIGEAVAAAVDAGEGLHEPWVARRLTRVLDGRHSLFVSNSMPIRDVQYYGVKDRPELDVHANRGASGIDGIISTAAGYAQGAGNPLTLLIGDLATLHDVNALASLSTLPHPVTTIILNNGGGSIFHLLPLAGYTDVLTPYVDTPHNVRFEGVCASFGLTYARVESRAAFDEAYALAVASGASSVIEVVSGLEANRAVHEGIEAAARKALPPA